MVLCVEACLAKSDMLSQKDYLTVKKTRFIEKPVYKNNNNAIYQSTLRRPTGKVLVCVIASKWNLEV